MRKVLRYTTVKVLRYTRRKVLCYTTRKVLRYTRTKVLRYIRRKMLRYTRRETVDTNTGWREGETSESCWCQAGLTWGLGAGAGLLPHLRHTARLTHPGIAAALAGLCKEGTCYRYHMSAIQTGRHDNSASFNLLYQSQVTMPTRTRLVRFKWNI